jgi:membrane associated rhomboid family serine protease
LFPIGDDNSQNRSFPIITYAFITLNALFFMLELTTGDSFIIQWSFIPKRFLADPLSGLPTIFTSMFMHAGWLHLLGNMLYLWIFGDNVEDRFGRINFALFYLLCGITATLAQMAFNTGSNIPNLGASGAIAGVLGAYIFMFPRSRVSVLMGRAIIPVPAFLVLGLWIFLQLFSGLDSISNTADTGGVAYIAHIGGFIAGLILTTIFRLIQKK